MSEKQEAPPDYETASSQQPLGSGMENPGYTQQAPPYTAPGYPPPHAWGYTPPQPGYPPQDYAGYPTPQPPGYHPDPKHVCPPYQAYTQQQAPVPGPYYSGPTVVTMQPASVLGTDPEIIALRRRNTGYMIFAGVVTFCCNIILGGVALLLGVWAEHDFTRGDKNSGKTKSTAGLALSILGVVLTIVIVFIFICYYIRLVNSFDKSY